MTGVRFTDGARAGLRYTAVFLATLVVGGGGLGLGAYLLEPQIGPLLGAGTVDRAQVAGGAVLALLGAVVLLTGLFALAYALVAEAAAAGVEAAGPVTSGDAPAADRATGAESGPDAEGGATPAGGDVPSVEPDRATGPAPGTAEADPVPETAAAQAPGSEAGSTGAAQAPPADDPAPTAGREAPQEPTPAGTDAGEPWAPSPAADATGDTDSEGREPGDDTAEGDGESGDPVPDQPPEPSPEEIVFGTSSGTPGEDDDSAEPPAEAGEDVDVTDGDSEGVTDGDDPETTGSSASVEPAGKDAPSDPLGDRGDD